MLKHAIEIYLKKLAPFSFLLMCLSSCWDYDKELLNGYIYVRASADVHVITDENRRQVIGPDIKTYAQDERYVIGLNVCKDIKEIDDKFAQKCGYFILDTLTGEALIGLEKAEFTNLLGLKGIEALASKLNYDLV